MNIRLLQMADSALPIGGYTHSWGLETAISDRLVHDAESLERWTRSWLDRSLGPLEGMLVAASCRSAHAREPEAAAAANLRADAMIVAPSIRRASREMGDQLMTLGLTWSWASADLTTFVRATTDDHRGWHHPVAFGVLGAIAGAGPEEVLLAYLHQAALGMIGAGVRAIPVGHTHGQQILAYTQDLIVDLTADLLGRAPETAGAGCPFYEILCDEQPRLYARLFRS